MEGVTKGLDKAMASMDLEKVCILILVSTSKKMIMRSDHL